MIAKLRRRHRRSWVLLAAVLATTLVLATFLRRPGRVMERLPEALTTASKP